MSNQVIKKDHLSFIPVIICNVTPRIPRLPERKPPQPYAHEPTPYKSHIINPQWQNPGADYYGYTCHDPEKMQY